jgi:hypothetical protein
MKQLALLIIGVAVLFFAIKIIRAVRFWTNLERLYEKQCLIKNGMTLSEVYDVLDRDINIQPQLVIRFNEKDTTYSHRAYFPMRWNSEEVLSIEYDPFTSVVKNFPECNTRAGAESSTTKK